MTAQTAFQPKREDVPFNKWADPVGLATTSTGYSPAVAWYNGNFYVVWTKADRSFGCVTGSGTSAWFAQQILQGFDPQSISSPALAQTHNGLLLVWLNSSNEICASTFDGNQWTQPLPVPSSNAPFSSSGAPAIASFGTNVLMVFKDQNNQIWFSLFDGTSWSSAQPVDGATTDATPALTFLEEEDRVLMAWKTSDGRLLTLRYHTWLRTWQEPGEVGTAFGQWNAKAGPALTHYEQLPLMAWTGMDMLPYYAIYDGRNWLLRGSITSTTKLQTALAYNGEKVCLVWTYADDGSHADEGKLYFSLVDSPERTADFGQNPGNIAFAVSHDEVVKKTLIVLPQGGTQYAKGRLSRSRNSNGNIVIEISNGVSSTHAIKSLDAFYHNNDIEKWLTVTPDGERWKIMLDAQLIGTSSGALHVRVEWEEKTTGQPRRNKEDPVIIVNVGN